MRIVALTGGIGSGKSTVSKMFSELGVHIIDADQLAREAIALGSHGYQQILATFGTEILEPAPEINRKKLAAIVFTDPRKKQVLEEIVHPEVRRIFKERVAEITTLDPDAIIIYEIPLLVESGQSHEFQTVITISAAEATRKNRLIANRGLTAEEAEARIKSQAPEAARLKIADFVIHTDTSIEETRNQVVEVFQQLQNIAAS